MRLFYVYVYVLYELFFFHRIDNVVHLRFYVNMCVFYDKHTYLITLLTSQ